MKRIVSLVLALILCCALLAPAFAGSNDDVTYAWVKTGNGKTLNLRDAANKNSQVIAKLPYRAQLVILSQSNGWALVEPVDPKLSSNPGYVMTSYLVLSDPGPWKEDPQAEGPTYEDVDNAVKALKVLSEPYTTVIKTKKPTNYVHLRWIPNTEARYIEKYLCDTEILVLAQSKTWAQVQIVEDGYVGFILRSCVAEPAD